MNFYSPIAIKELLSRYQAKPQKFMGQNFLIDELALNKILLATQLSSDDTVVEIGPGIGTLTQALAKKAGRVIAIEKDRAMVEILKETLKDFRNVEVIHADVLAENYPLPITHYKLIANIPYYITAPIIRKYLEDKNQPQEIILMVQKEVAQRICAKPPDMSILAVSVQFYATPKIISSVSKGCFWPVPNVDSAIIKITPFENKNLLNADAFFDLVKAGFAQPRKQLAGNLVKKFNTNKQNIEAWLLKNGIQPKQRAETLSIQDWQRLTDDLAYLD